MIRRTPTRIELKLDDISEYKQIKREAEAKRAMAKHNLLGSSPINTVQADAAPPPNKPDLATIQIVSKSRWLSRPWLAWRCSTPMCTTSGCHIKRA